MNRSRILIVALICNLPPSLVLGETSLLWGAKGEKWSPTSRLPDFSFAGYRSGEKPIPMPEVKGNVREFGAKGDGITDDTKAFEDAIAAVEGGAILVPAGRYVISRVLYIRKSNLVIRGEGPGKTILTFPRSMLDILGRRGGTGEHDNWSWAGGFFWVEGVQVGPKLADITADADRGATGLTVSTTAGLSVGQRVRLQQTDSDDGSLVRQLLAGNGTASGFNTGRNWIRMPVRITAISGNRITIDRPLGVDYRREWSPQVRTCNPTVEEVGIEGMTLDYPLEKYPGHWNEVGANGFWFNGVQNSWVRDIVFHNSDNGVFFENSAFLTATGLRFTADPGRINVHTTAIYGSTALPFAGHHGLQTRYSEDCLFSDFRFDVLFVHDLTVENASGNVFHSGSSIDLNLDHHAQIPFDNLFTNLDMGRGTRTWNSGGGSPKAGVRNTYWNLKSTGNITPVNWPMMNFVGVRTTSAAATGSTGRWIEPISPSSLEPQNIYLAQLERRLGRLPNSMQAGLPVPGQERRVQALERVLSPLFRAEPSGPSGYPRYFDGRGKRIDAGTLDIR